MNMTKLNNKKDLNENLQFAIEPKTVQKDTEEMTKILDAHYEKVNLSNVVKYHSCHLIARKNMMVRRTYYCSVRIYLKECLGDTGNCTNFLYLKFIIQIYFEFNFILLLINLTNQVQKYIFVAKS